MQISGHLQPVTSPGNAATRSKHVDPQHKKQRFAVVMSHDRMLVHPKALSFPLIAFTVRLSTRWQLLPSLQPHV